MPAKLIVITHLSLQYRYETRQKHEFKHLPYLWIADTIIHWNKFTHREFLWMCLQSFANGQKNPDCTISSKIHLYELQDILCIRSQLQHSYATATGRRVMNSTRVLFTLFKISVILQQCWQNFTVHIANSRKNKISINWRAGFFYGKCLATLPYNYGKFWTVFE